MRLKSAVPAAALLLAAGMPVTCAQAQQVGTIYGFGDSLLDVARNCPIAFPQSAPYGACGNGRGSLQWLSQLTSYSFIKSNDYAYNGVGNGVFPAFNGGPTVAQQIVEFTSAGRSFQPNDVIVVGGMPNNSAAPLLGILDPNGLPYTPQTLSAATLSQQYSNISQLIKAGGHNFVVENMFSSSAYNFYVIGGFYPLGAPYAFPNIPGRRRSSVWSTIILRPRSRRWPGRAYAFTSSTLPRSTPRPTPIRPAWVSRPVRPAFSTETASPRRRTCRTSISCSICTRRTPGMP